MTSIVSKSVFRSCINKSSLFFNVASLSVTAFNSVSEYDSLISSRVIAGHILCFKTLQRGHYLTMFFTVQRYC